MKHILFLLALLLLAGCKQQKKETETQDNTAITVVEDEKPAYPEGLGLILEAHGGLEQWKTMKSLVYEIPKKDFSEVHSIDLYSRKDRVDTPGYSMGFDGTVVWLDDPEGKYNGDPVFYHNLMFYFYAMPFVLADRGIVYSETEDLIFEGKNYPGIGIGYGEGVGTSPEDEYFIHYDPDTSQMAWLGYTVTYRTGEKSENVKWIRYGEWQETQGINLPKSITWYEYEGREIKEAKNTVSFENVKLSREALDLETFEKPENAEIAESKMPS